MRKLTTEQKKLLLKILNADYQDSIRGVDDLSYDVWDKLKEINDTEILYTEVNRYIDDYRFSPAYDRRSLVAMKIDFTDPFVKKEKRSKLRY